MASTITDRYPEINMGETKKGIEQLRERTQLFFQCFDYPTDLDINISSYDLMHIVLRADKRKVYYEYFHDMEIDEVKEAGLCAYWILKFHPLTITDPRYKGHSLCECINEAFAVFIIYSAVYGIYPTEKDMQFTPTDDKSFCGKLLYSFRFRSISLDAMILLAESITPQTLRKRYENNR
jgi:hypothetical protein